MGPTFLSDDPGPEAPPLMDESTWAAEVEQPELFEVGESRFVGDAIAHDE
jgi:hypothetical protein